jgi:hypothetical protein
MIRNLDILFGDILTVDLPQEEFDIVRSRGVVHHLGVPALGLARYASWTKTGGYVHFNCYRAGTFYYYGVQQLRSAVSPEDLDTVLNHAESKGCDGRQIGILMDDLFVPTLHTVTHQTLAHDMEKLSLRVLWPMREWAGLDHDILYPDLPQKDEHLQYWTQKMRSLDARPEETAEDLKYRSGVDDVAFAGRLEFAEPSLSAFERYLPAVRSAPVRARASSVVDLYMLHHFQLSIQPMTGPRRHRLLAEAVCEQISQL